MAESDRARTATPHDSEIGRRIRTRRIELGLTQTQLGEVLGVSFQQVQKYEKGKNRLSGSRLARTADALNIDVGELLSGERADPPDAALRDFITSKDGAQLARLFVRLDKGNRAAVLRLAKSLSSKA